MSLRDTPDEVLGYIEETRLGWRSHPMTAHHTGKHIVFMGDSFTFGEGLELEDTWAYKTHSKISASEENVEGFYNIGISGASIKDCIDVFFKYADMHGNPDVIFFMTTEIDRDIKHSTPETVNEFVYNQYKKLEDYCILNSISLYAFSWVKDVGLYSKEPKRYLFESDEGKVTRPLWTEQVSQHGERGLLSSFSTFYDYSNDLMLERVYEFDKASKDGKKSMWALDGVHPGTSFHEFYSEFIYDKYVVDNRFHLL